jgi:hypothetical protein
MNDEANELKLYIVNDGDLHRQQGEPILKNLATKKARGIYKHDLAVKLYGYLVEAGAKKYAREFDDPARWHKLFDVPTRKAVAEALTKSFETEYKLGNYDHLLPKKYQKPSKTSHATKKSMADYEAEGYNAHTWYLASSPYTQPKIRDAWQRGAWKWQQEQRAKKGGAAHATKKSPAQLDREIHQFIARGRR